MKNSSLKICSDISRSSVLKHDDIEKLFNNKLGLINIPNFYSKNECIRIRDQISNIHFTPYLGHPVSSGLKKFGPLQCEYSQNNYFELAQSAYENLKKILIISPVLKIIELLKDLNKYTSVTIAKTMTPSSAQTYFAGVIHKMNNQGMDLHMDFAPHDAQGWSIEKVTAQLSWILPLEVPDCGGTLEIFERPWQPHDELLYRNSQSYHYDSSIVEGYNSHSITPQAGELIIFNSRNFHRVSKAVGQRMTMGSFMGLFPDNSIQLWS